MMQVSHVLTRLFLRGMSEIDEVEEAREPARSALLVREDRKRRDDEEIGDCSHFALDISSTNVSDARQVRRNCPWNVSVVSRFAREQMYSLTSPCSNHSSIATMRCLTSSKLTQSDTSYG